MALYFLSWASRVSAVIDAATPEKALERVRAEDAELSAEEPSVIRELPAGLLALDVDPDEDGIRLLPDEAFFVALERLEAAGDRALAEVRRKAAALASTMPAPAEVAESIAYCSASIDDGEGRVLRCQEPDGHAGPHHEDHDGVRSEWGEEGGAS